MMMLIHELTVAAQRDRERSLDRVLAGRRRLAVDGPSAVQGIRERIRRGVGARPVVDVPVGPPRVDRRSA